MKKLQQRINELESGIEAEVMKGGESREALQVAERRTKGLADEMEEKTLEMGRLEKVKRTLEIELDEVKNSIV